MRKLLLTFGLFSLLVSISLLNARSNSYAEETVPRYKITDLTVALGKKDNTVFAQAINNNGEIAGTVSGSIFLLSSGKIRTIGKLPGSTSCEVRDLNDKSEVLGTCSFPYTEKNRGSLWPPSKYFLWQDEKIKNLGDAPEYFAEIKISNRSQVVLNKGAIAALWQNGREKNLGDWVASAINDDGEVLGTRFAQSEKAKKAKRGDLDVMWPVTWKDGVETRAGNNDSYGIFFNSNRDMVLGKGMFAGYENSSGYYLFKQGKQIQLDKRNSDEYIRPFYVNAMNDNCQVVGWQTNVGAFLWQGERRFNLNNLIPAKSDWALHFAKDINERGQIIGHGRIKKDKRAFLLTPISQPAKP